MKPFYLYCLLVLLGFSIQQNVSGADLREGPVERRQLLIPTGDFGLSEMENRFRQLWAAKDAGVQILQIDAMDRPESISLSENGYNDISYELWQALLEQYKEKIPPYAELLSIGKDVGMRIRDWNGQVFLKVLAGDNPYDLEACGKHLQVGHVSIRQTGALEKGHISDRTRLYIHFFLIVKETPDRHIVECALAQLRKKTGLTSLSVSVRSDPWFLQNSDYPVISPFLVNPEPPTRDGYESGTQWDCTFQAGKTNCNGGHRRFP